jgi:sugar phosphate isomerase/epimerase
MAFVSRRDAGKLLLAGCAGALAPVGKLRGATKINSVVRGVQIGAQSSSFYRLPLNGCIDAFRRVGLGECELWWGHLVPPGYDSADVGRWGLMAPLGSFKEVRKKFDDSGIVLYSLNWVFPRVNTDEEFERGFQIAQAMGVKYITATSTNVSAAPRVDKLAQKYKIMVGLHNHDWINEPDLFASSEAYARALKGASPYLGVTLDVGHFASGGEDAITFIKEYNERMVTLHLKDRKKNHGDNVPWGEGDTPIVAVLHLLRDNGRKFPVNIAYQYGKPGMDTIAEVKKCFDYCKMALES